MDQREGDEIIATARLRAALENHILAVEEPPAELSAQAGALYEQHSQP